MAPSLPVLNQSKSLRHVFFGRVQKKILPGRQEYRRSSLRWNSQYQGRYPLQGYIDQAYEYLVPLAINFIDRLT